MAAPQVRRADFLMALAYATDLATGHSRDFALRSCVPGMRFADVAGLDQDMRRRTYGRKFIPSATGPRAVMDDPGVQERWFQITWRSSLHRHEATS